MLVSFWVRRKYALMRCLMRGNSWSKRNAGFAAMRHLQKGLIAVPVGTVKSGAEWFFGSSAPRAELVVRQYVFDRYGGGRLNRALFEHLGCKCPIGIGMPAAWRNYLEDMGWTVSHLRSWLAWQIAVTLRLAYGVQYLCRLCMRLAMAREVTVSAPYAYFEGLTSANLPTRSDDEVSYDICSFYAQWSDRSPRVQEIRHDVSGAAECKAGRFRISPLPPAYELATGLLNALRLAWWGGWTTLLAALQLLVGQWHWALMLGEAVRAKAVRLVPSGKLASEYMFHVSRTIYRPMWTYEVERAGSTVAVYFYSTYVQPKLASGYESQDFEWGPNTWPRFIVWDHYQAERIRSDLGPTVEVLKAGPIYFSDSGLAIPRLPPNSIAVFDIQPHRPSLHFGISTMADCLAEHPDFYHRFLSDVTDVLKECGAVAVLKTKREIDARGDRKYGQILQRLRRSPTVRIVDPGLSAWHIATRCRAGISAPFTSTAIHVQTQGIPSVYYDPVGWIQRDDDGAHGIAVLCGKEALRAWVLTILTAKLTAS